MPTSFIESNDASFGKQINNFATKIKQYKTILGFTDAEVAEAENDAAYWDYTLQADVAVETYAQNFKAYKINARTGSKNNTVLGAFPVLAAFGTAPTAVDANIQARFSQKAAKAKLSNNYTEAIGKDLGIEASVGSFDPSAGKPSFTLSINGKRPEIRFTKGKYNGVSIYKDSGDGKGYQFLDKAFYVTYSDKSTLPEAGKTALWKYKLIYLFHDEETGSMSDEVSISVVGE
jgi:hypothetical protein